MNAITRIVIDVVWMISNNVWNCEKTKNGKLEIQLPDGVPERIRTSDPTLRS